MSFGGPRIDHPVCCSFGGKELPRLCYLDEAASGEQITRSIAKMGLVAGFLSKLAGRAVRYGGARDVAHLEGKTEDG